MEFGLLNGLSQRIPYDDQIKDLRYQEQLDKQSNIAAANKAKMFADDFQYNNAMNSFDNPRVKQFSQFQIKKIGKFVNENPDWETNMEKRAQYSTMLRELKDNPELNRGLMSDEGKKAYLKDLFEKSKNPETFNKEGYDDVAKQWNNYQKYGHQLGKEYADKEGLKEFTYQQPNDKIDYVKRGQQIGEKLAQQYISEDNGQVRGSVPIESIYSVAKNIYSEDPDQANRSAKKAGLFNSDGTPDGIGFVTKNIEPYAKSSLTKGYNTNSNKFGGYGSMTSVPQATVTKKNDQTEVYTPLNKVETISVGGKQYNVNAIHSTFDKTGNIIGGFAIDADIAAENNKNKRLRQIEYSKLDAELKKLKDEYAPMINNSSSEKTRQNALKSLEVLAKDMHDRRVNVDLSYPIDTNEKINLDKQQAIEMQAGKLKVHPEDIVNGKAKGKVVITENDERSKSKYTPSQEATIKKNMVANPDYTREEIIKSLGY